MDKDLNIFQNAEVDLKVNGGPTNIGAFLGSYDKVILKPNKKGSKNVLEQWMLSAPHTKYVIKYDFTLEDTIIEMPNDAILEIDCGSLQHGTLVGKSTGLINTNKVDNALVDITLDGTWNTQAVPDKPAGDGMGKVYLKQGVHLSEQMTKENTIYVVQYDFELDKNITIPANCVLEFEGGSISGNNELIFVNTSLLNMSKGIIRCNYSGTLKGVEKVYLSHFVSTDSLVNGKIQEFISFALVNNCTAIFDESFITNENVVIYPGSDTLGDKPGPKIKGFDNVIITYTGNSDFITIYPYANPLDTSHRAFFNGGFIRNLKFIANSNEKANSIINIRGWWHFEISNIVINSELSNFSSQIKVKYGLFFPTYSDNGNYINPDHYASAEGDINNCQIRACDIGIYDQVENGVPHLYIRNNIIDYNVIGIKCMSSSWNISSGSISWNRNIGISFGNDNSNYACNNINIERIEFDGNGYYENGTAIYIVGMLASTIRNCNSVIRYVDGQTAGNTNFVELSSANRSIQNCTIKDNRFVTDDITTAYCIIYSKINDMSGGWINNTIENNIFLNGNNPKIMDGLNSQFYNHFFLSKFNNILIEHNTVSKGIITQYILVSIEDEISTSLDIDNYASLYGITTNNTLNIENGNTILIHHAGRYKFSFLGMFYQFTQKFDLTICIYVNGTIVLVNSFTIDKVDNYCGVEFPIDIDSDNSVIAIGLASTENAMKRKTFTCEISKVV